MTAIPKQTASLSEVVSTCLQSIVSVVPAGEAILTASAGSYAHWWNTVFSQEHDPSQLRGESNHFRYRPYQHVLLRAEGMGELQIAQVVLGTITCGVKLDVSVARQTDLTRALNCSVIEESEAQLIERLAMSSTKYGSLRVEALSVDLQVATNKAGLQVIARPPLANGRLELLAYLREQSVSETTHRYGNIIPKASEIPDC